MACTSASGPSTTNLQAGCTGVVREGAYRGQRQHDSSRRHFVASRWETAAKIEGDAPIDVRGRWAEKWEIGRAQVVLGSRPGENWKTAASPHTPFHNLQHRNLAPCKAPSGGGSCLWQLHTPGPARDSTNYTAGAVVSCACGTGFVLSARTALHGTRPRQQGSIRSDRKGVARGRRSLVIGGSPPPPLCAGRTWTAWTNAGAQTIFYLGTPLSAHSLLQHRGPYHPSGSA